MSIIKYTVTVGARSAKPEFIEREVDTERDAAFITWAMGYAEQQALQDARALPAGSTEAEKAAAQAKRRQSLDAREVPTRGAGTSIVAKAVAEALSGLEVIVESLIAAGVSEETARAQASVVQAGIEAGKKKKKDKPA